MMSTIIEEVPIRIKKQYELLNRLAEGYKTLSKALMEYIDNSFDSADSFFDENSKLFNKEIIIDIVIDRDKQKISIKDNCTGMNDNTLKGLANSINDSEKREGQKRAWVAGKFGLGAHAYRFFAQKLTVTSKTVNGPRIAIEIDRDNDHASLIYPKVVSFDQSGTLIELEDVDKDHLKKISAEELKNDIEIYFEMLLKRNIKITIFDRDLKLCCKTFDYSSLNGIEIKKKISSWKEDNVIATIPEIKGVEVNLKVCSQKIEPPRPPFFSRKGRRINYGNYILDRPKIR